MERITPLAASFASVGVFTLEYGFQPTSFQPKRGQSKHGVASNGRKQFQKHMPLDRSDANCDMPSVVALGKILIVGFTFPCVFVGSAKTQFFLPMKQYECHKQIEGYQ